MVTGGVAGSVGVGAIAGAANPASAVANNDVDDMQAKLDQLKNM